MGFLNAPRHWDLSRLGWDRERILLIVDCGFIGQGSRCIQYLEILRPSSHRSLPKGLLLGGNQTKYLDQPMTCSNTGCELPPQIPLRMPSPQLTIALPTLTSFCSCEGGAHIHYPNMASKYKTPRAHAYLDRLQRTCTGLAEVTNCDLFCRLLSSDLAAASSWQPSHNGGFAEFHTESGRTPKETRVIWGLSEAYVRLMLRCITMSVHFRTFGCSGRIQGVESGLNLTSNVFRLSPPSKTGPLVGAVLAAFKRARGASKG